MTDYIKDHVEICNDMSCVIMNESGQAISDSVMEIVDKKPTKGSLFVVEQYYRFNPNDKWWVVTFDYDKTKDDCNGF